MAADSISGYVQAFLDGIEFRQTVYALDRDFKSCSWLLPKEGFQISDQEAAEEERRLAA